MTVRLAGGQWRRNPRDIGGHDDANAGAVAEYVRGANEQGLVLEP